MAGGRAGMLKRRRGKIPLDALGSTSIGKGSRQCSEALKAFCPRDTNQLGKLMVDNLMEKAREIGADEESSRADEQVGAFAKKPPEPKVKTRK